MHISYVLIVCLFQVNLFQDICLIYCTSYIIDDVNMHQVNLIATP